MLVNWQKGSSPSHVLPNSTLGVVSTTKRLFSKPQSAGSETIF